MLKVIGYMDQYIFKPQRQFFMQHLRFNTVDPTHLILFVLGVSFLDLLMLASTNYLVNFLAALVIVPLGGLIQAMETLDHTRVISTSRFKITLMMLISESLLYIGALLYNTNQGDAVFTLLAALSLLGLWLQHVLNDKKNFEIKMLPLELRYFLLALTTLLTLNFIYFLIFLVLIYGQVFINAKYLIKK